MTAIPYALYRKVCRADDPPPTPEHVARIQAHTGTVDTPVNPAGFGDGDLTALADRIAAGRPS